LSDIHSHRWILILAIKLSYILSIVILEEQLLDHVIINIWLDFFYFFILIDLNMLKEIASLALGKKEGGVYPVRKI
jgi:hypothetical protein